MMTEAQTGRDATTMGMATAMRPSLLKALNRSFKSVPLLFIQVINTDRSELSNALSGQSVKDEEAEL